MTRLISGALGVAALVVVAIVIFGGGGGNPYTVTAIYEDAAGLTANYDVKVDGVPAGVIKKVDLNDRDQAVLTLELDAGAVPIGAGARALARPANLLGEKYIDLDRGDVSRPQPSGVTIPVTHTGSPVELDDVLNTLDAGTRARLRILINEAGTALVGRGADFNAMLRVLPGALDQTQRVVSEAASDNVRLRHVIDAGDRIMAEVDDKHSDLQRLVTSAGAALTTVAERREDLGATVAAGPAALHTLAGTLDDLERTSRDLIPTAAALRQAAPPLAAALAALPEFAGQASATLDAATDIAPTLAAFGRRSTPQLERLDTTARRLGAFAADTAPVVRGLDRGVLRDAISLMHGWSQVIARSDGLGHIFRVRVNVDQELLTSALTRYSGSLEPAAKAEPSPGRRRPPKRGAEPSDPVTAPQPAATRPPAKPGLLDPALEDVPQTVSNVTEAVGKLLDPLTQDLAGGPGLLPQLGGAGDRSSGKDAGSMQLLDYLLGD